MIDNNAKTNAATLARVQLARNKLQSGLVELQVVTSFSGGGTRREGIARLEQAREEFLAIAKDLAGDKSKDVTLRSQLYYLASQAELALVGIVKEGVPIADRDNPANHRGTIARVNELLQEAAKVVGEETDAGKKLKQRGADLLAAEASGAKNKTNPTPTYLGILLNETLLVESKAPSTIQEPTVIPPVIDPTRPSATIRTPPRHAPPPRHAKMAV